ncbi:MAG: LytTR family transcriptional regulator [Flavobacteriaceae bacterium]
MKFLKTKYPFDPSIKHHAIIALGLSIWIFLFLYFTEPLDVNQLSDKEKLLYLPIYGLIGGFCYSIFIPVQVLLFKKRKQFWAVGSELLFLFIFSFGSSALARLYYLYVIVADQPNPYTLDYYITDILVPAITIILPILIFGRFAFGKYKEKKLEQSKIEIKGEGTYEGLRLLLNDLICIQSSDNYIEVLYYSGKEIKKSLIRNKLSVIADEFPELIRTHRSYIINPYHFQQWKTEKGKLLIELSSSIFVPLSTTYKSDVKAVINSATT